MVSVKLATLGLFKIKIFKKKGYDVSATKFCHITQIILKIWSCDQSLVTLAFL